MVIPVDEFVSFSGFGGGIKAAELEFLNLLHIESIWFRYYYRIKWQKIQKKLAKNCPRISARADAGSGKQISELSRTPSERGLHQRPRRVRKCPTRSMSSSILVDWGLCRGGLRNKSIYNFNNNIRHNCVLCIEHPVSFWNLICPERVIWCPIICLFKNPLFPMIPIRLTGM